MKIPTTQYWLDKNDTIIRVSRTWDQFAKHNDGEEVFSQKVIGKKLNDFITDNETKAWLQAVIGYARYLGKTVERPYCCDSPDEKRFMKMTIAPSSDGNVVLTHEVVSTKKLAKRTKFKLADDQKNHIKRCSICNSLEFDNQWIPIEDAIKEYDFKDNGTVFVAYTVCNSCMQEMPIFADENYE